MSEPYGGPYSPTPQTGSNSAFKGSKPKRINVLARLMYFTPLPLFGAVILDVMSGSVGALTLKLGALGSLILSAWLVNEGLRAEAAYDARKVARPPSVPRKLFALAFTGLGLALATYVGRMDGSLIGAVGYGLVGALVQFFAFGLDPMKKKGMEGMDEFETDRVARAVDKAEELVAGLLDASKRIGDRALQSRVEGLAGRAREVFRTVEEDPRDLGRARKFMTVYLRGARDATAKFADIWTQSKGKDLDARAKFEALLSDLEGSFTAHRETLLLENRSDLEVEIDVLRERLQQEGVPAR